METVTQPKRNWWKTFAVLAVVTLVSGAINAGCGKKQNAAAPPPPPPPPPIDPMNPTCDTCGGYAGFLVSGLGRNFAMNGARMELTMEFFGDAGQIQSIQQAAQMDPYAAYASYSGPVGARGVLRILQSDGPVDIPGVCHLPSGTYEIRVTNPGYWIGSQSFGNLMIEGVGPAHLILSLPNNFLSAAAAPGSRGLDGSLYPYRLKNYMYLEAVNNIPCYNYRYMLE